MNKNIKQLWITALKSGSYEQGTNFLRNAHNQFCCLGVLCDVIESEWIISNIWDAYATDGYTSALPTEVADMTGVDELDQGILVNKNDTGQSFTEIANWIEENL